MDTTPYGSYMGLHWNLRGIDSGISSPFSMVQSLNRSTLFACIFSDQKEIHKNN